ncbi:MAG: HNH endonuclease [Cohaesibacteraceae bacterium]|nr:HNH endonuclease [Cohaesibacteraceae bacterium]MBL4876164.1 HNH endonuclease [Cohaesibacteraceae bacterium]
MNPFPKPVAAPLKTIRRVFTPKTRAAAVSRDNGLCQDCDIHLTTGTVEYDHVIACGLGGDNDLGNCACLCKACHRAKTDRDQAAIAKTKRIHNKCHDIRTRKYCAQKIRSRGFQTRMTKSFDGTVKRRTAKRRRLPITPIDDEPTEYVSAA